MGYSRQLMPYMPYASSFLPTMFPPRPRNNQNYRSSAGQSLTTYRRKKRKAIPSFRTLVERTKPTKHFTISQGQTFTQNTLYTANVTAGVVQGDGIANRDGDSITLTGLKINGQYFSDAVAGAYTFRIMVGYSGEEYGGSAFASGLGSTELFQPNTAVSFTTLGTVNPRAFTILHDQKIDLNSQIASVVDVASMSIYVPLNNAKFDYQASGSVYGKTKNLYVVVMACVGGGTPGTTVTGSIVASFDLLFK